MFTNSMIRTPRLIVFLFTKSAVGLGKKMLGPGLAQDVYMCEL